MPRKAEKKIESMASILILGGAIPLCVALVGQFAFGLFPCEFCLLQRYPYGVAMAAGVVSLLVPRLSTAWKLVVFIGALSFATTGALGVYHTGIERGWVKYEGGCVADTSASSSIDELRDSILNAPRVSCADAETYVGLSMASWNVLFALTMLLLVFLQYRFEVRHDAR